MIVLGLVAALLAATAAIVTTVAPTAAAGPNELVSRAKDNTPIGVGENEQPSISGDGAFVAFTDVVNVIGLAQVQVAGGYLRDRAAQATTPVRELPNGFTGDTSARISRDGCHVAFLGAPVTPATVVVPGVYVTDRCPTTTPAQRIATLNPNDNFPTDLAISSNGRFVAWSFQTNAAPFAMHLLVFDRQTNAQTEIPLKPDGPSSFPQPSFSDENNGVVRLAFTAERDNRTGATTTPRANVYVWDSTGFNGANPARYQLISTEPDPTTNTYVTMRDPAIDGVGLHVAYDACRTGCDGTPAVLTVVNIATGERRVINSQGIEATAPDWNQDGTQLAFAVRGRQAGCVVCTDIGIATDTGGFFAQPKFDFIEHEPGFRVDPNNPYVFLTPKLSSTGRFVAFEAKPGNAGDPSLNLANPQVFVRPRPAAVAVAPADFGAVAVGTGSNLVTITVTNTGASEFVPAQISTTSAEFAVMGGTCAAGTPLPAQQSCTVQLRFTPAQAGARTAQLVLAEAGFAAVTAQGALTGTGVTFTLQLTPPTAAFAPVAVGASSAPAAFTVTNTGTAANAIAGVAPAGGQAGDFAVTNNGCAGANLAPGKTCAVAVQFHPSAAGNRTSTLTVTGAGGSSAQSGLSGTGVAPATTATTGTTGTTAPTNPGALTIDPPTVDLGPVNVGLTASTSFVVTNTGTGTTNVQSVTLAGDGAASYTITSNGCASQALAPRQTCTIGVTFTPTAATAQAATLTVGGSGGTSATASLTARGNLQPTLRFNPAVVTAGMATTALGTSFPPGARLDLAFDGFAGSFSVTVQSDGTFRLPVLTLARQATGTRTMLVNDPSGRFDTVQAPLLVVTATYQPQSATGAAFALVSRG